MGTYIHTNISYMLYIGLDNYIKNFAANDYSQGESDNELDIWFIAQVNNIT